MNYLVSDGGKYYGEKFSREGGGKFRDGFIEEVTIRGLNKVKE